MKRYDAGIQGEQEAENALTRQGMTVRTRRYRAEDGEIDLVMQDGETIVFVEVKARSRTNFGTPGEFVTNAKRRQLTLAAEAYLVQEVVLDRPARFDVVEVYLSSGEINHIVNAFDASPT